MASKKGQGRPKVLKSERIQISLRLSEESLEALDELVTKQIELVRERALFPIEVNRNVIIEYLIQSEMKRVELAQQDEKYPMPFILNPFTPHPLEVSEQPSEHEATTHTDYFKNPVGNNDDKTVNDDEVNNNNNEGENGNE